jgi:hypothetical protein
LPASQIPAGKGFGEARDRTENYGDDCPLRAAETGFSPVSPSQSPGKLKTIPPAAGNRIRAGLRGGGRIPLQPVSTPNSLITGKLTGNFLILGPFPRFLFLIGE